MAGVRAAHQELSGLRWHEARRRGDRRLLRAALESTWLARRSQRFDVVHHFGGRLPARRSGKSVLTVHDIQPLDIAANFSMAKRRYLRWALPRSVHSADLVTVPSHWTAKRLVDRLGAAPERIRVVPSTYRAAGGPVDPAPLGGRRFLLYPAATYPHKNHALLIGAHAAAWPRHRGTLLVLTGPPGRAHAEVGDLVARTDGVMHLGMVDEATLASLMAAAAAVVFPSRYEGFGLPLLEAMHCGTPVIAADATAVPEVLDGAGTLLDPCDRDCLGGCAGRGGVGFEQCHRRRGSGAWHGPPTSPRTGWPTGCCKPGTTPREQRSRCGCWCCVRISSPTPLPPVWS